MLKIWEEGSRANLINREGKGQEKSEDLGRLKQLGGAAGRNARGERSCSSTGVVHTLRGFSRASLSGGRAGCILLSPKRKAEGMLSQTRYQPASLPHEYVLSHPSGRKFAGNAGSRSRIIGTGNHRRHSFRGTGEQQKSSRWTADTARGGEEAPFRKGRLTWKTAKQYDPFRQRS